jgi:branched-chain amino acid transport system substrate-binding protein
VTGDASKLADERAAIREKLTKIRFSGILGKDICFAGQDAELPGYVIQIKDGKWTKLDQWPADNCPAN